MFVTIEKTNINYEMAKLNSKKQKNFAFTEKKNLVGLTPDKDNFETISRAK